ncbi:MAG: NADH-ubiquinone oxidoreductase-F iron-sulfur binding region domain-containing protein [Patescibacteria group bacterium]
MSKTVNFTSVNILAKIADAGLVGRGGASYPTAAKWSAVKAALKGRKQGYIILNGAEGEPGVKKDGFIIRHYPAEVIEGLDLADRFLGPDKIKRVYLFLNQAYFKNYASGLRQVLARQKYRTLRPKTEFFIKPERLTYISGEESALLNLIEGKKVEPRIRPPYPTEYGLYGRPTLVNNTETFYNVALAVSGRYEEKRFYTVSGAVKHPGVYQLSVHATIAEVLKHTNNWPIFPFFVQAGGEASGEILNEQQLDQPVEGAGSIMVYDKKRTNKHKLIKYWLKFYHEQSCGQCTACREGSSRLLELIDAHPFDHELFWEIVGALEESSFCALGSSLPVPLKSYFNNIKN